MNQTDIWIKYYSGPLLSGKVKMKEYLIKACFVGDVAGKTCLVNRIARGTFSELWQATIGVNFMLHRIVDEAVDAEFIYQLWDIAGQERFGNMTRIYYRNAFLFIVCFNIADESTFAGAGKWAGNIHEVCPTMSNIILVGNFADRREPPKTNIISIERAEKLRAQIGAVAYYECSARTGQGVDQLVRGIHQFTSKKIAEDDRRSKSTMTYAPPKLDFWAQTRDAVLRQMDDSHGVTTDHIGINSGNEGNRYIGNLDL